MTNHQDIVEKLSLFNNISFNKKQWEIVLEGCGCPKSCHFWAALRANNLHKEHRIYTLIDINTESFEAIWTKYCQINRASVKKAYDKEKARQKARQRVGKLQGMTLYIINGVVTPLKPSRDE